MIEAQASSNPAVPNCCFQSDFSVGGSHVRRATGTQGDGQRSDAVSRDLRDNGVAAVEGSSTVPCADRDRDDRLGFLVGDDTDRLIVPGRSLAGSLMSFCRSTLPLLDTFTETRDGVMEPSVFTVRIRPPRAGSCFAEHAQRSTSAKKGTSRPECRIGVDYHDFARIVGVAPGSS